MSNNRSAALAAFTGAACLIGSVVVGVTLMQTTGGTAASAALGTQPQLLTLAELLKFGSAAAAIPVIGALTSRLKASSVKAATPIALVGYLGALLLAVSGAIGLVVLYTSLLEPVAGAALANRVGLASAAATGLWAALCGVSGWKGGLPKWLGAVGILLALPSIAMVAVPPAGLLTAVVGLVWLIGLGHLFLKKPAG